jgi:hypothetical protein
MMFYERTDNYSNDQNDAPGPSPLLLYPGQQTDMSLAGLLSSASDDFRKNEWNEQTDPPTHA